MNTDLPGLGESERMQAMVYGYDQLHRIVQARSLSGSQSTGFDSRSPGANKYDTDYSYDPNGNLLSLQRRDEQTAIQEDLTYSYYDVTNKLKNVDGSTTENYTYDEIGNLVSDNAEGIDSIIWTPYGKVRAVYKDDNSEVHFRYDASGNRIAKITETDTTIYARDASGNVMAVYKNDTLIEQSIYGSSRLGLMTASSKEGYRTLGGKKYELSNHLGNVLAVVSDNIHLDQDSTWASVVNVTDYYPFGLAMDGRSVQDSTYRYGFNGKESDDEIKDYKGSYDFGARLYDTRVGKWLSVDPKANLRSWMSPFNFVQNNPIMRIDPDGRLDGEYTIDKNTGETNKISDLGDNEGIDFYSVGESRDKGTAFVADQTFTIERNADGGNINMFRIQEDSKGTISSFHIPQNETTGFFLEPGGPSTTQANQDKRIPEGQFNLILSKDRPGVNADNLRFPNNFVLYNQDVSMGRGITFHSGNFNDQTEGCPMPGCGFGIGQVGQAGIKTPIQIQDRSDFLRTTQSIPKLKVINSFINTQGAENVKINIHNAITQ